MKKKKGFTLVELLAVIVVLAIIALIATPTILGVIEKARKASYKDSIYGIIESANIYLATNINSIGKNEEIVFTCNGISCSNNEGDKLSFKGSVPKSGSFYVNRKGEVTVESVYNGRYYANTVGEDIEITEEDTTLTRTELTNLVKELQQQVKELQEQVNNKSEVSQLTNLTSKHDSDVNNINNNIALINSRLGSTSISNVGDGTITGSINYLNQNLNNVMTSTHLLTATISDTTTTYEFDITGGYKYFLVCLRNGAGNMDCKFAPGFSHTATMILYNSQNTWDSIQFLYVSGNKWNVRGSSLSSLGKQYGIVISINGIK